MTVIVQPGTDSNGNPQPMVYDQDTGKVIVDSNGFIVSGGQRLVNVPSKADYVNTAKTQTSGILEAVKYSYGSESSPQTPVKITAGHFLISPDATLYKVNTSAPITGAPEYAIIPVPTSNQSSSEPIQNIVIHGSGGLINSGGTGNNNFNYDSMTVIDVSQVPAPAGETVMTFAWDMSVNTDGTNAIDIRDFAIYQAVPVASGDNIVGGCDFHNSWDSIALNIGILSPNNFFTTVFPSSDEIGFAIDAQIGNLCWVDGLSVYCNYYGAVLGAHTHVGTYVSQSNYIGLIPETKHGVDMVRYDTQACIYNIYQTTSSFGSARIFLLDGEDYSAVNSSANQTVADVYMESGSYSYYPEIEIENFHIDYNNSSPNPRLPVIQNNGTGYYVTVKHIESQPSSTSGTTAGTVQPYVIEYGTNYKKMIFQFSGYENESTTDQTIDFPTNGAPHSNSLNFSTSAGISLNTTGLTISASTTGITITAPDSTTTYSGIVIVEGY